MENVRALRTVIAGLNVRGIGPGVHLPPPKPILGLARIGRPRGTARRQRCTVQLIAALRPRCAGAGRQSPGCRAGFITRSVPATRRPWQCRAARALGWAATTRVAKRDHRSGADGRRVSLPSRAPARP
eukprot:scaffold51012_cov69-Phaeocystis_antarctica.AAC.1